MSVVPVAADELMRRVCAREASAFEQIYEAHHRLVFAIGRGFLGDVASAEDLTQSVFLKIWANPTTFRGGSVEAWLSRVARNAAIDVLRRRSTIRNAWVWDDGLVDGVPEAVVLAEADAQSVRDALRDLPLKERLSIEMGFFGEMTHSSISQETGVPLGTVKTRIRAGLRRLREALEPEINDTSQR